MWKDTFIPFIKMDRWIVFSAFTECKYLCQAKKVKWNVWLRKVISIRSFQKCAGKAKQKSSQVLDKVNLVKNCQAPFDHGCWWFCASFTGCTSIWGAFKWSLNYWIKNIKHFTQVLAGQSKCWDNAFPWSFPQSICAHHLSCNLLGGGWFEMSLLHQL